MRQDNEELEELADRLIRALKFDPAPKPTFLYFDSQKSQPL